MKKWRDEYGVRRKILGFFVLFKRKDYEISADVTNGSIGLISLKTSEDMLSKVWFHILGNEEDEVCVLVINGFVARVWLL